MPRRSAGVLRRDATCASACDAPVARVCFIIAYARGCMILLPASTAHNALRGTTGGRDLPTTARLGGRVALEAGPARRGGGCMCGPPGRRQQNTHARPG